MRDIDLSTTHLLLDKLSSVYYFYCPETEGEEMNKNTTNKTSINVNDKRPPYDTGKIKIGVFYERPKPQQQSEEDLMWQSLLLGDRPNPVLPPMSSHRSVVYTLIGVGAYILLSLIVH